MQSSQTWCWVPDYLENQTYVGTLFCEKHRIPLETPSIVYRNYLEALRAGGHAQKVRSRLQELGVPDADAGAECTMLTRDNAESQMILPSEFARMLSPMSIPLDQVEGFASDPELMGQ